MQNRLKERVNKKQERKKEDRRHLMELLRSGRMSLEKYMTGIGNVFVFHCTVSVPESQKERGKGPLMVSHHAT